MTVRLYCTGFSSQLSMPHLPFRTPVSQIDPTDPYRLLDLLQPGPIAAEGVDIGRLEFARRYAILE